MGKIVRMAGYRNRGRPPHGDPARIFGLRRSPSIAIALALVAAIGVVGVWGFLTAPESTGQATALFGGGTCHPSYTGKCLPMTGDVDCADVGATVRVTGPDVYLLDRDGDGEGCEPAPF